MTQDRSYTSSEKWLFQFCGCRSWTELWERFTGGELEPLQHLTALGILDVIKIRNLMIAERVAPQANKTEAIRQIAEELNLSEPAVRQAAYNPDRSFRD